MSRPPKIGSITEIGPSSKLHTASLFAANERTAQIIYFIDNNKPYYYDAVNNVEYEMNIEGFPSDETITYISNRYDRNASKKFDYLTIATYKNGKYNIYMYDMVGGLPYGKAVRTTSGTGKVKETHYLNTTKFDSNTDMYISYGMDCGYSR